MIERGGECSVNENERAREYKIWEINDTMNSNNGPKSGIREI